MIREHILRTGLAALILLGLSACGPTYDGLDIGYVSGHIDAEASSEKFLVPEGAVIVFSVDAEGSGVRDYEVTDTVELTTENAGIARVVQGLATGTWMLMGTATGRTVLEVRINGELEDRIPVDVTAQEVSS